MYDDFEYVDTFTNDINKLYSEYSVIVEKFNKENPHTRDLIVKISTGKKRYTEIDVVDKQYNDIVLLTVFKTVLNKTTDKYIIPLSTLVNEDKVLNDITYALDNSMFYTMLAMKSSNDLIKVI